MNIINIELTNKCNKDCWMCGRRKVEKEKPEFYKTYNEEMDFDLLIKLNEQIPDGTLVQFHNNGEPLMYSRLGDTLKLFKNKIRCLDTNGILLVKKYDEIVDNLETITLSTFENDEQSHRQIDILRGFLHKKGSKKPRVIIRCLGEISDFLMSEYKRMGDLIVKRILHSPMGSFDYKKETVIPEHGICLEMLGHPAIRLNGDVSICVRFDPDKKGVLGNIKEQTLQEIWNGKKRKKWLEEHINGNRQNIPLCKTCDFWGIPRG